MAMDKGDFLRNRPMRALSALVVLFVAGMLLPASNCLAQKVPPVVVTTSTNIVVYSVVTPPATPPPSEFPTFNNGKGIEGTFGSLAVDQLGDLFLGGYNLNEALEFPANGGQPVSLYNSDTNGHVGPVAIDPYGNLIVGERYTTATTMVPYVHGTYTPYSAPSGGPSYPGGGSAPTPPVCTTPTPASGAACSYDYPIFYSATPVTQIGGGQTNNLTGGYYQNIALAFDGQGNSYLATAADSNGDNNIYECSVACNYGTGLPVQILNFANPTASGPAGSCYTASDYQQIAGFAVDAAGDVFITNMTGFIYEVPAGSNSSGTDNMITFASGFISAQGLSFDQSGNLYVSDNGNTVKTGGTCVSSSDGGLFEIPLENGKLNPADSFMVLPLTTTSGSGANNQNQWGVAVDQHGNIYTALGYTSLLKFTVGNATLPATAIGSTSAPATLTLTFNGSAVTLNNPTITTAGVASSEFSVIGAGATNAGTCTTGTANAGLSSCTIAVQFAPTQPGLRTAILTLTDTAGDSIPVYLSGIGTGQAITVDPGTQTVIGSGLKTPGAVTVDGAGNVFIADAGANKVYEYPGGSGTGVAVGSGLKSPGGVATDSAGNLYISDTGNNRVVEVPNVGGILKTSAQSTLLSNLKSPGQLTVDATGTLYIPETGNNDVVTYVNRTGLAAGAVTTVPATAADGLSSPTAVAVDSNFNLYVASKASSTVVEESDGAISNVGSSLVGPTGVAVDNSGSVIIADNGGGRIIRVPNEVGVLAGSDQVIIDSSILSPYAVALDQYGNLYATDSANAAAYAINRTSGNINFGQVNDLTSSAEQTAFLASSGPENLMLGMPLFPAVPSGTPFSIVAGASEGCVDGGTVLSGYTCSLETQFSPETQAGPQTYSVDFTTGAQNTSAPSLVLTGDAVNLLPATITLTQTVPATGNASYGNPVTVSATVASATSAVTTTPTGTVQFLVDGGNFGQPKALVDGVASLVIAGLTGGPHQVAASYSGPGPYAPVSSSILTVTIVPDSSVTTLSVIGYASNPLTAEPPNSTNTGDTVTMTATVVPENPGALSGPVVFTNGVGGAVLGTAQVTGTTTNNVTTYTATLTTTGATALAAGTYNIVATYQGNANYTLSQSAATQIIITTPTYVLTQSASSITTSVSNPGSMTITATSESGFTGGVDFACTGLPANATCQFIPAVLPLATAPANGSPEISVPALSTVVTVLVNQSPVVTPTSIFWWSGMLLGLGLFGFASTRNARRKLLMQCAAGCLLLVSLTGLSACGGGTSFTTPTGSSTITVTATATPASSTTVPNPGTSDVIQTMTFSLTVK